MNDTSRSRKKQKITYTATTEGIQRAKRALTRLGFGSKANFAESILISRSTVTKFFGGKSIQLDSFQRICDELTLNWLEIADLPAEESLTSVANQEKRLSEVNNEDMQSISTSIRQVVVTDRQNNTTKAVITLLENLNILTSILKEYGGDTIVIENIKQGSIKVFISGSLEDIERLKSRIESGEIKEINKFPVENIEITSKSDKWRLVEEIVNHPVKGRSLESVDLSDADLSDADLSLADLRGADLRGADLSDADLSLADLSDADLSDADLSLADLRGAHLNGADLSDADLSLADLRGAHLNGADLRGAHLNGAHLNGAHLNGAHLNGAHLRGANVKNTRFSDNKGISESLKQDLITRGAIFEDSPGDRSGVLTRA